MAGYPLAHAAMMMIPEAWENHELMDERRRAFYEYHAAMMEPWDGPAAMVFTDGRRSAPRWTATACARRATGHRRRPGGHGLRIRRAAHPREQDRQEVAPAAGQDVPDRPGAGPHRRRRGAEEPVANARPTASGSTTSASLDDVPPDAGPSAFKESLLDRQQAFGYTQEDIKFLLAPMAINGEEGIGSMGNDSPLAVLSDKNKPLYNYFKQLFAQVTNPPIDPIREAIVMSLNSFIGPKPNLLDINAVNPPMRLEVHQPVLDFRHGAPAQHRAETHGKFKTYELDITYPLAWGKEGVEAKLASLCAEAVDAIQSGHNILIITDKAMDRDNVAIPALLALSAIHQHLVREGLRTSAGLVVETGSAREVHHFAVLAGYGAEAVHPYLALET
jgi:glutamate synthase (NADPH/NADH) large chain